MQFATYCLAAVVISLIPWAIAGFTFHLAQRSVRRERDRDERP